MFWVVWYSRELNAVTETGTNELTFVSNNAGYVIYNVYDDNVSLFPSRRWS